jgi:hypothetical protein
VLGEEGRRGDCSRPPIDRPRSRPRRCTSGLPVRLGGPRSVPESLPLPPHPARRRRCSPPVGRLLRPRSTALRELAGLAETPTRTELRAAAIDLRFPSGLPAILLEVLRGGGSGKWLRRTSCRARKAQPHGRACGVMLPPEGVSTSRRKRCRLAHSTLPTAEVGVRTRARWGYQTESRRSQTGQNAEVSGGDEGSNLSGIRGAISREDRPLARKRARQD